MKIDELSVLLSECDADVVVLSVCMKHVAM